METNEIIDTVQLFTEQYQLPSEFNRRELITDIVCWLDEFSDNTDAIFIDAITIVLNGIKSNFKYSYRITLFL